MCIWTLSFRNSTNVICTPRSSSSFPRPPGWTIGAEVHAQGHEIGNHSVTHEHAADLNKAGEELQVEDAKKFLDSNFKSDIITFAYPYTEVSPGLLYWVRRYDFAARGGRGDGSHGLHQVRRSA